MVISRKTGWHPSVVRKCIRYFCYRVLFRKLPKGEKFHIRGVGQFNPGISTRNQAAKGERIRKTNVNKQDVQHHRRKFDALLRKAKKRNEKRDELLKTGWE